MRIYSEYGWVYIRYGGICIGWYSTSGGMVSNGTVNKFVQIGTSIIRIVGVK